MNCSAIIGLNQQAGDYQSYKRYALSIPQLTESEERELFGKYRRENCIKSVQALILSQLKTVVRIASQFKNYGLPEEDLVQEGNIGLMKAVKNYDLSKKVRLYTYAVVWIKSEIQSYVLKNWKLVKIGTTKNYKKLFFNLRSLQHEMLSLGKPKEELENYVSKKLGVEKAEVREMKGYFSLSDLSADYSEDESECGFEIVDERTPETLAEESIDGKKKMEILSKRLSDLDERQLEIIRGRFYDEPKKTHKEIAFKLGISSERVRQIEAAALSKMKLGLLEFANG